MIHLHLFSGKPLVTHLALVFPLQPLVATLALTSNTLKSMLDDWWPFLASLADIAPQEAEKATFCPLAVIPWLL